MWSGRSAAGRSLRSIVGAREAAAAACALTPEQTEGPYYLEDEPFRRDITEGSAGIPLLVRLKVRDVATCAPIEGAVVEIWHCDANGTYSGFGAGSGEEFLRGRQVANRFGRVRFRTIYPGWYRGRVTHIHCKVHVGGETVHTGQLYFDDAITDAVYANAPYSSRGSRDQTNATDGLFDADSLLALRRWSSGYMGKLAVGVAV